MLAYSRRGKYGRSSASKLGSNKHVAVAVGIRRVPLEFNYPNSYSSVYSLSSLQKPQARLTT